jgi:hypothetical protein
MKRGPETVSMLPLTRVTVTGRPGHGFTIVKDRPFSLRIFTYVTSPPLRSPVTRQAPNCRRLAQTPLTPRSRSAF